MCCQLKGDGIEIYMETEKMTGQKSSVINGDCESNENSEREGDDGSEENSRRSENAGQKEDGSAWYSVWGRDS